MIMSRRHAVGLGASTIESSSGLSARFAAPTITSMASTPISRAWPWMMAVGKAAPHDSASAILPLFAWLSPSYPVGSYAYSHTLEWAVEAGRRQRRGDRWRLARDLLDPGFWTERRHPPEPCLRADRGGRPRGPRRSQRAGACACRRPPNSTSKRRQQGRSFLDATLPPGRRRACSLEGDVAFPVAVGMAAAAH